MAERVRWGILSTANIARKCFVPGVAASRNGTVAAIASRDAAKARAAAEQLGIPRAYGSYEELLADPEIDAIYIGLPNSLHAEWTMKCADAGKPVLCEKPLAVSADEARRTIAYCASRGVPLMEAFMYRFHPQHAAVRGLIDAGEIGDLRAARLAFTFSLEPFPPANVRLQAELGGGALMDVGCYCVNAACMLFGETPQWASAQWDYRPEFGVEIALAATLGFSGERFAVFDCGFRGWGRGDTAWPVHPARSRYIRRSYRARTSPAGLRSPAPRERATWPSTASTSTGSRPRLSRHRCRPVRRRRFRSTTPCARYPSSKPCTRRRVPAAPVSP